MRERERSGGQRNSVNRMKTRAIGAWAFVLGSALVGTTCVNAVATSAATAAAAEHGGEAFTRELVNREVGEVAAIRSLPPLPNAGPELAASDFGFASAASPEQNATALEQLGLALTAQKASAVRFEPGDYPVQLRRGKAALVLAELANFTLKGNGARLVLRDAAQAGSAPGFLVIRNCQRLQVSELSLVWDWDNRPLAVVGRITAVGPDFLRYEVVSGGLLRRDFAITGGREWDVATATRALTGYGAGNFSGGAAEILDDKTLVFKGRPTGQPHVGMATLLPIPPRWSGAGVVLAGKNDHLTFDRLELRGVPNVAFTGVSKHLWIHHSVVAPPRPGLFKACHDGFMPRAEFYVFEHTEVSYCNDDVMNFEAARLGTFLGGGVLAHGTHSLIADRLQRFASAEGIVVGATTFLATRDFKPLPWRSRIKSVEWQPGYHPVQGRTPVDRCVLSFEDSVPSLDGYDSKDLLLMIDQQNRGAFVIRNNQFSHNLCHGIWGGNGPGLIENNRFSHTGYPAIGVLMTLRWGRWYHGFYPEGLIIRGNRLEACNEVRRQPADLFVGASIDTPQRFEPVNYAVVRHVIIEDNEIRGSAQAAIGVFSGENVVVKNNRVIAPGRLPLVKEAVSPAAIFGLHVTGLKLSGNLIEGDDGSVRGIEVKHCENRIEE